MHSPGKHTARLAPVPGSVRLDPFTAMVTFLLDGPSVGVMGQGTGLWYLMVKPTGAPRGSGEALAPPRHPSEE